MKCGTHLFIEEILLLDEVFIASKARRRFEPMRANFELNPYHHINRLDN
jgi:hypothetical protein